MLPAYSGRLRRQVGLTVWILLLALALAAAPAAAADQAPDPAAEAEITAEAEIDTAISGDLPDPGMLPDDPFYFAERLWERLQVMFTFSPEARVQLLAKFMDRRSAEMAESSAEGNDEAVETSAEGQAQVTEQAYAELRTALEQADLSNEPSAQLQAAMDALMSASTRAEAVLMAVSARVDGNAQAGIETALSAQYEGQGETLALLSEARAETDLHVAFGELAASLEARLTIGVNGILNDVGVPLPEGPELLP